MRAKVDEDGPLGGRKLDRRPMAELMANLPRELNDLMNDARDRQPNLQTQLQVAIEADSSYGVVKALRDNGWCELAGQIAGLVADDYQRSRQGVVVL